MSKQDLHSNENSSLQDKLSIWVRLIGSRDTFSLESRIFHSISICLIALLCVYTPYNLFAGLYVSAVSTAIVGIFFSVQYYYSRFRGIPHSSVLFGLLGVLIFGVNYFSNSGINGSTDLIWPVYLLLVLAISPYQQHLLWLIFYMVCFFIIHILEYQYPDWVSYPFTEGKGQFIDRIAAFPIPVVALYIIIRFIRRSYDQERQLAENKKTAIQTLMSIISHDLRTPLINIQSYLRLINEIDLPEQDRIKLERDLLQSTNSTVDMLSNLLHWSKSQMDGTRVLLTEVNLLQSLLSTLEMQKLYASEKEIVFEYNISLKLFVIADLDMLQLVVRNLISNAIKFTPRAGRIQVDAEITSGTCKITIMDTGKGISPEKQAQIFNNKSAPSFGTNNEKGVGLGLILCKDFTERQGGRIAFESRVGIGTSFFVYLPLGTSS